MSNKGYEELILLNKKLDELINSYHNLKNENADLISRNKNLELKLQDRESEMKELEKSYEKVKLSGALLGEGENAGEAKRRITVLMREIDKCIALLDR
jgi:site-specific DNA-adenine methylase